MSTNTYPEEIYKATNESGKEWAERIYDLGKKHATQDTWTLLDHDLPIDYVKLDFRAVKIKYPDGRVITGVHYRFLQDKYACVASLMGEWSELLAGYENDGCTIYIKGELPLRKRTADELEHGTVFKVSMIDGTLLAILVEHEDGKNVLGLEHVLNLSAENVVVHEVIGNIRDLFKKESE